jgi:uncharacterized protein (DUF433 family)
MFDRIAFDPKIMGGRACIRGMRMPVSVIVRQIAHGAGFEEILEDYYTCREIHIHLKTSKACLHRST